MVKRCPGTKVNGEWTGFQCVLDEGHAERFCQPYIPPDVDEWRSMKASVDVFQRALSEIRQRVRQGLAMLDVRSVQAFSKGYNDGDMARVVVERDRLVLAVCAAKDDAALVRADRDRLQSELDALRAVVERHQVGLDLDAEVLRAVQTHRDELAELARKGDA
jgi:hypothetical protein